MTQHQRTSGMAVVGAVIALTPGVVLLAGMHLWTAFAVLLGAVASISLGVASLIRIMLSEGRLRGRAWAWAGIMLSLGVLLLWSGVPFSVPRTG